MNLKEMIMVSNTENGLELVYEDGQYVLKLNDWMTLHGDFDALVELLAGDHEEVNHG